MAEAGLDSNCIFIFFSSASIGAPLWSSVCDLVMLSAGTQEIL
jgi:hypothetical protein